MCLLRPRLLLTSCPTLRRAEKRKAPTSADTFGATLTSLLTTDPTPPSKRPRAQPSTAQQPILSLSAKAVPPSSNTLALEARAKRVIKAQKAEREDRARVRDVVEGWAPSGDAAQGGQERERSLRKVAQRGGGSCCLLDSRGRV